MPMPELPETHTLDSEPESEEALAEAGTSTREDQDFSACNTMITRAELNNLFRDWSTPKQRISHLCHGFSRGTF
jgi:hypothetical protein